MGSRCLENLPNVSDIRKIYVVWTLLPHYVSQKIIQLHSVSYVYAVLPFYDVKCLFSGGQEWGREESHSH